MRVRYFTTAVALAFSVSACGSATSKEKIDETTVAGSIGGIELTAAHAGYVTQSLRNGGEVGMLILSNRPDVCRSITNQINVELFEVYDVRPGSMVLAWTIFGNAFAIREGPVEFGVPAFEGPSDFPPPATRQYGFPQLSHTPTSCENGRTHLGPVQVDSIRTDAEPQFQFQFQTYKPEEDRVTGTFAVRRGSEGLEGEFTAAVCTERNQKIEFLPCSDAP